MTTLRSKGRKREGKEGEGYDNRAKKGDGRGRARANRTETLARRSKGSKREGRQRVKKRGDRRGRARAKRTKTITTLRSNLGSKKRGQGVRSKGREREARRLK